MFIDFDSIIKDAKKHGRFNLSSENYWIAIKDNGHMFFCPNTIKLLKNIDNEGIWYQRARIWVTETEESSVELFFSHLSLHKKGKNIHNTKNTIISNSEFVILNQVLKIPDGFVKLYPFSYSNARSNWACNFKFIFHLSNSISVPCP